MRRGHRCRLSLLSSATSHFSSACSSSHEKYVPVTHSRIRGFRVVATLLNGLSFLSERPCLLRASNSRLCLSAVFERCRAFRELRVCSVLCIASSVIQRKGEIAIIMWLIYSLDSRISCTSAQSTHCCKSRHRRSS